MFLAKVLIKFFDFEFGRMAFIENLYVGYPRLISANTWSHN